MSNLSHGRTQLAPSPLPRRFGSRWRVVSWAAMGVAVTWTWLAGHAGEVARGETAPASLREALSTEDHARVIELATVGLQDESASSSLWYLRGRSHFCLGKIPEAVADFDRYIQLSPDQKPRQWERGIALYYAGQFAEGAEQFELYQTYHDNDVENSVWRFLCLVPTVGLERARETMLPIRDDRRIPMMALYRLYRGEGTVEQVWEAVRSGSPTPAELAGREFYALLYLGLFHEARGESALAAKYLRRAADEHRENRQVNRYMWQVARVHAERLPAREQPPE
jgi:lipoprotein NlpI